DLQKCTDEELVKYQLHENQWYVRHARRILQERAPEISRDAKRSAAVHGVLFKIATENMNESNRLRALWAIRACGASAMSFSAGAYLDDRNTSPTFQGWIIRTHCDLERLHQSIEFPADDLRHLEKNNGTWIINAHEMLHFMEARKAGNTPVGRRFIASELQRVTIKSRPRVLAQLLSHGEDATDPNLPYLYWYALEPLTDIDAAGCLKIVTEGKIPQLVGWTARKIGMSGTPEAISLLVKSAAEAKSAEQQIAILQGIQIGLRGKRRFPMPKEWNAAFPALMKSASGDVRNQAQALAVVFGDKNAFAALRNVVTDAKAVAAARAAALDSLVEARDAEIVPILQLLVADPSLRGAALRALAAFDDPKTPDVILAAYSNFTTAEKRDALATLSARLPYARAMMKAMAEKKIPAADVSAETIRQLRNLQDKELDKAIASLWGSVRETPAERKKLIDLWKVKMTNKGLPPLDLSLGRSVFAKTCQQCHTLYGIGGKVGPDITGANRSNLDYLLENILDPSGVIPKEYAATRIALVDGRVVTGIVKEETKAALTVVTATETSIIPLADIETRKPSELSMMPDDILKTTTEHELRNLIAYLQSPAQVPMLATTENAKEFFNGKDLTGWDGDKAVWSVEDGEIVGKTDKGLKKNTFLKSHLTVADFKLSLKVKLTPNTANSGVQFRSEPLPDGEMRGPQADIGAGWWGKLYEESGRGLLAKEGGEKFVKAGEWNDYAVEAKGAHVKIWINGNLVCDYEDAKLSRRGVVGLQVHSGGPTEVRFKDIKLEVLK
ncbi:MAG TPA: family 16 glycoside hydrolase, partial [Urbifossiella sp.]|nr:family 16 glycoside hydrolase [Urbifossiella sp.]